MKRAVHLMTSSYIFSKSCGHHIRFNLLNLHVIGRSENKQIKSAPYLHLQTKMPAAWSDRGDSRRPHQRLLNPRLPPVGPSFFFSSFPFLSTAHLLGDPRLLESTPATEPFEVEVLRPSD
jgi:hypothetical protein